MQREALLQLVHPGAVKIAYVRASGVLVTGTPPALSRRAALRHLDWPAYAAATGGSHRAAGKVAPATSTAELLHAARGAALANARPRNTVTVCCLPYTAAEVEAVAAATITAAVRRHAARRRRLEDTAAMLRLHCCCVAMRLRRWQLRWLASLSAEEAGTLSDRAFLHSAAAALAPALGDTAALRAVRPPRTPGALPVICCS